MVNVGLRSIEIFGGIVRAVADILHDGLAGIAAGGIGRIHQLPCRAVKIDDSLDPAALFAPGVYPGVIGLSRISDDQLCRYALAPEHGRHDGGIVEAYALARREDGVDVGQITALDRLGLLGVVADILYDIGVDLVDLFKGIGLARRQLGSLFDNGTVGRIVDILVGKQEGGVFTFERDVKEGRIYRAVFCPRDILVDTDGVFAAAVGKGEHLVAAVGVEIICVLDL